MAAGSRVAGDGDAQADGGALARPQRGVVGRKTDVPARRQPLERESGAVVAVAAIAQVNQPVRLTAGGGGRRPGNQQQREAVGLRNLQFQRNGRYVRRLMVILGAQRNRVRAGGRVGRDGDIDAHDFRHAHTDDESVTAVEFLDASDRRPAGVVALRFYDQPRRRAAGIVERNRTEEELHRLARRYRVLRGGQQLEAGRDQRATVTRLNVEPRLVGGQRTCRDAQLRQRPGRLHSRVGDDGQLARLERRERQCLGRATDPRAADRDFERVTAVAVVGNCKAQRRRDVAEQLRLGGHRDRDAEILVDCDVGMEPRQPRARRRLNHGVRGLDRLGVVGRGDSERNGRRAAGRD